MDSHVIQQDSLQDCSSRQIDSQTSASCRQDAGHDAGPPTPVDRLSSCATAHRDPRPQAAASAAVPRNGHGYQHTDRQLGLQGLQAALERHVEVPDAAGERRWFDDSLPARPVSTAVPCDAATAGLRYHMLLLYHVGRGWCSVPSEHCMRRFSEHQHLPWHRMLLRAASLLSCCTSRLLDARPALTVTCRCQGLQSVPPAAAKEMIDSGKWVLVDIRPTQKHQAAHPRGAKNVQLYQKASDLRT